MRPADSDLQWDAPWDRIVDAYRSRFGELESYDSVALCETGLDEMELDEDFEENDGVVCWILQFRRVNAGATEIAYATLGASVHTGGFELFTLSATPCSTLSSTLLEVIGAPIGARCVVPLDQRYAFVGATLLAPDEGSFELPRLGRGRPKTALQLVPITSAEAELAARDHAALVSALRKGGALERMDPTRSCTLTPEPTFWNEQRREILCKTYGFIERSKVTRRRMLELDAPEIVLGERARVAEHARELIAFLLGQPEPLPVDLAIFVRRLPAFNDLVDGVLRELGDVLSPEVEAAADGFIRFVLATHPRAAPLMSEFFALPSRSLSDHPAEAVRRMGRMLVAVSGGSPVDYHFAQVTHEAMRKRVDLALRGLASADAASLWLVTTRKWFDDLSSDPHNAGSAHAKLMRNAAVASVARGFLDDDSEGRSPEERLRDAARAIAMDMHIAERGQTPSFGGALTGRSRLPS